MKANLKKVWNQILVEKVVVLLLSTMSRSFYIKDIIMILYLFTWTKSLKENIFIYGLNALQLFSSPPIKNTQLWNVRSRCTFVIGSSNFLCRFQYVMALSSNFFGPVHYVLPGKKTQNTTFAAPVKLRLVSKNHKKLIHFLS